MLEQFRHFVGEGFTAEVVADDDALGVDKVHGGDELHFVEVGDAGGVTEVVPGEFLFLQRFLPVFLFFVDGDADDVEAFGGIGGVELLQVGYLLAAGSAPGCPEVDEEVALAAAEVGEGDGVAVLVLHGEGGNGGAFLAGRGDFMDDLLPVVGFLGFGGEGFVPGQLVGGEVGEKADHHEGSPVGVFIVHHHAAVGLFHLLEKLPVGSRGC